MMKRVPSGQSIEDFDPDLPWGGEETYIFSELSHADTVVKIVAPMEKHGYCFFSRATGVGHGEETIRPHLSKSIRKRLEVNIRKCALEEKRKFEEDKYKELD